MSPRRRCKLITYTSALTERLLTACLLGVGCCSRCTSLLLTLLLNILLDILLQSLLHLDHVYRILPVPGHVVGPQQRGGPSALNMGSALRTFQVAELMKRLNKIKDDNRITINVFKKH